MIFFFTESTKVNRVLQQVRQISWVLNTGDNKLLRSAFFSFKAGWGSLIGQLHLYNNSKKSLFLWDLNKNAQFSIFCHLILGIAIILTADITWTYLFIALNLGKFSMNNIERFSLDKEALHWKCIPDHAFMYMERTVLFLFLIARFIYLMRQLQSTWCS